MERPSIMTSYADLNENLVVPGGCSETCIGLCKMFPRLRTSLDLFRCSSSNGGPSDPATT